MKYDAIIIGAGHNGLTTATVLAKAGRRVLVLESRPVVGGLASGCEFHPGYRTQGLLLDTSGVRRSVVDDLGLERYHLKFEEEPAVYIPQKDGPGLTLHRDPAVMANKNEGSSKDKKAYKEYREFLSRISGLVRTVLEHEAPPIADSGFAGFGALVRSGLALRLLGRDTMLEVLRIAPMCVSDWLNEQFSDNLLKAALAQPALHGSFMGPWSAGSVATLLIGECSAKGSVRGGPAALARALEAAAKDHGVEVRTATKVSRIRFKDGAVSGVLTDKGEFEAPVVASSLDPKNTFYNLLGTADIPIALDDQIRVIRMRGTTAKVNLALKGPLEFSARPGELFAAARTGEALDELERAFDAVKYGRFSEKPILDIRVPTVTDTSLAPRDHHVVEILVHFAPYDLKGGWTDEKRTSLGDTVVDTLAEYAPTLKERMAAREVLTPKDLEECYGLSSGHIYHGEQALDQLYSFRPSADCAQYATPLPGLFLCGSGSHPGGGITCAPGALAARAILKRT